MLKYLLKRLVQMVVVLFTVSVIVFLVMSFTGDPVLMIVPPTATDAQIAEARTPRLDRPGCSTGSSCRTSSGGGLGVSYIFKRPALSLIVERMPPPSSWSSPVLLSVAVVPCGVYAGRANSLQPGGHGGSLLGISLPSTGEHSPHLLLRRGEGGLPSSGRATAPLFGINLPHLGRLPTSSPG